MSIMSMFSRGNGQPAPAEPTPQGQQQPAGQQAAPANPSMTGQPAPVQPEGSQGTQDPLDAFKDLWTPPAEGEAGEQDFDPASMFQINPEQIQQAVSKMNFTGAITTDQMQKIAAGGEEAQQAFAEAMNSVAQQAFTQSMLGNAELVKSAMSRANDHLGRRMDKQIKQNAVSSSLRKDNPVLNHPAASPIVKALELQFTNKYPQASSEEITKLAQDYLTHFGQSFVKPATTETSPKLDDVDWEKFFDNQ